MLNLHRDKNIVRREPGRDGKILCDHRQDGNDEVVVVVVVVSHIQRIGCQPEKNYFTRWPIPLVVC